MKINKMNIVNKIKSLALFAASICIFFVSANCAYADVTETMTSQVFDRFKTVGDTTVDWTDDTPSGTSISVRVRSGDGPVPNMFWTAWKNASKNQTFSDLTGRYVQYEVIFYSSDGLSVPSLSDITITYDGYIFVLSSPYDTQDAITTVDSINWTEQISGNSNVMFQIRTSPDGSTWTDWCGPDDGVATTCDKYAYFTDPSGGETVDTLFSDKVDDRWIQYKIWLFSDNVADPKVSEVSLNYSVDQTFSRTYTEMFTSEVKDIGTSSKLYLIDWDVDVPIQTSLLVEFRAGDVAVPDGSWSEWTPIAKSESLTDFGGNRYFQYRSTLSSSDGHAVPAVNEVSVRLSTFGSMISSPYDAGDAANLPSKISWTEVNPADIEAKFQIRTSPDGSTWTDWCGPDDGVAGSCSTDTYFTASDGSEVLDDILTDGVNDAWMQYSVYIETNNMSSASISDITMTYVVNAAPELQNATATQNSSGLVDISYEVRDIDTTAGTYTQGYVTPSFEYWNGSAWVNCTTLEATDVAMKAVEEVNYLTYTATWNAVTDSANIYQGGTAKIRISVDDGEAANNITQIETNAYTLDTKKPALGAVPVEVDAREIPAELTFSLTDDSSVFMKISLKSDVTDVEWVPYSNSSTIQFETKPDTVYVQFKDEYNNQTLIQSVTTPEIPKALMIQDTTNVMGGPPSDYRAFVAWKVVTEPTAGFASYQLYKSGDGLDFTLLDTISDRMINYYSDSDLSFDEDVYYKVVTVDNDGNSSFYSEFVRGKINGIQDAGEGGGGTSSVPPVITNVATSSVNTAQATITWDTDILSNSTVSYSATPGSFVSEVGVSTMADDTSGVGQHKVVLSGLTPNTEYYFRVQSIDANGNIASTTPNANGFTFRTMEGVVISDVSTPVITNNSITVSWNTDSEADSYVTYSTSPSMDTTQQKGSADLTTNHSVVLDGLTTGVEYFFFVTSDVAKDDNSGQLYSAVTTRDDAAPIIFFNIDDDLFDITDTSAEVYWTTDEQATTSIRYGTSTDYKYILENDSLNMSHNYDLSDLVVGEQYYFKLIATDANGNTGMDDNSGLGYTFTTVDSSDYDAPEIYEVEASLVTDVKAFIVWDTDENANSSIRYGTTSGNYTASSSSSSLTTKHGLKLFDLTENQEYFYIVYSTDASGNTATSEEFSFTTSEKLTKESEIQEKIDEATEEAKKSAGGGGVIIIDKRDKVAPTISNISLEEVGASTARIKWETNEDADTLVEYGLDQTYGYVFGNNRDNTREHNVTIKWLDPESKYNFRVTSIDGSGNLASSKNQEFTTISKAAEVEQELERELTFEEVEELTQEDTRTDEEVLEAATNKALDLIKGAAEKVSLASLEKNLTNQFSSLKDLADMIPGPMLSGEPKVITTADSATIAWRTDKESSSLVAVSKEDRYKPGTANPYVQVVGNANDLTTQHVVTLYDLEPNTIYHYQVRSKSELGPESESQDFVFETERETLDITNYSIDKVDTETTVFKWLTNIEANSKVRAIPYRNNVLSVDEAMEVESDAYSVIHEIELNNLEAGVIYDIELVSTSLDEKTASHKIDAFATSKDDLPPLISQVQTDSALSPGKDVRVQTIISWRTNEPSTTRVIYEKGVGGTDDKLTQKTKLDLNYTKKHVVVLTKFESGSVYRFRVESTDSGGNTSLSKVYTVLTPRQSESVFQVIMKNMEGMFGWVGNIKR